MLYSLHKLANFLMLCFIFEAAKATGLRLKLIHRDSIESPFYPGNLTRNERIKIQFQTASAYATMVSNNVVPSSGIKRSNFETKLIRPRMDNEYLMYSVEAGIGTFSPPRSPYYKYFLHLDTANDLTWTQCEECRKMGRGSCFLQKAPLFPASQSSTYRTLPCNRHPLCFPGQCINNTTCTYSILYGDGAMTLGYLASESLSFHSDDNKTETIKGTVFGCGIKNKGFMESSKNNLVAGNFGLGPGKLSFLNQKKSITQGRFSYCLPPWDVAHNFTIFLRFGGDIRQREGLKVTPLSIYQGFSSYYVELKGISIGNKRIPVPQSTFARRGKRSGGCIVDSGSSMTIIPPRIYTKLQEMLIKNHFLSYKSMKGFMRLCYWFPRKTGLKDLPNITFHMQNSDIELLPQQIYVTGRKVFGKYFCLAMLAEDINGMTIIGAFQQANTRFVFDTVKRKMYFGPEDCTL